MNAALYVLHYIHSTIDYGFTFTFELKAPLHTYTYVVPLPFGYRSIYDAQLPKLSDHHRLTTYSNACWGFQIGNMSSFPCLNSVA
jgi:hypothetical protein